MPRSASERSLPELYRRLQALMFLRVVLVSIFLGASLFIQLREGDTYFGQIHTAHFRIIVCIYLLTFVYVLILKYSRRLEWSAYLQLLVDTFSISAIVLATGGIDSIFSILYMLNIISAGIMLYRKGGLVIATACSLTYGAVLFCHYYGVISPLGGRGPGLGAYKGSEVVFLFMVNATGFYLVSYLSSYLSEQARRSHVELKAKQIDFDKLEALNESIIQGVDSGLIALDGSHRIILFNPAAEDIFGVKLTKVLGNQVETLFPFLLDHLKDGQPSSSYSPAKRGRFFDLCYPRDHGNDSYLRFCITPFPLPGSDQRGQILAFQDLTELRQIEEEMKRVEGLALIGELAAAIAHEIRNPLASISGSIQLLKEGFSKEDMNRRLMDIVMREIDRLNHLVNEFLLFARPRKANFEQFELNQLIQDSLDLFQKSQYWNKQIQVRRSFPCPVHIESDAEQIRQMLWNLFLNAVEAMPHGGSFFLATELLEPLPTENNVPAKVKVTVRDTGKGFESKALENLFTPFFTTKPEGSGLGLAIVKRITEGLKGQVEGTNHLDGGAEVSVILPLSRYVLTV
jgi:two-component system sensor histidine kinase PilS (NtrC family)